MGSFVQDLPPKEGYRPYEYKRIPLRTVMKGRYCLAFLLASPIVGHYFAYFDWKLAQKREIELRSAALAVRPLLLAERDRVFLKQLKRNVEDEKELMKDVPGWKVGTLYGERLYKTIPEDTFIEPSRFEYYVHSDLDDYGLALWVYQLN